MIIDRLSKFLSRKITEYLEDVYPHADFNLQYLGEFNLVAHSKSGLSPREISEIEELCDGELISTTQDLDKECFIYVFQM